MSFRRRAAFCSAGRRSFEPLEARQLLTATVIEVTTTADTVDAADGLISLREAVLAANATSDDVEIRLPAGNFQLTRTGANEDAAATGDLDILAGGQVTIQGAGADQTTIDAGPLYHAGTGHGDRIFHLFGGVTIDMADLKLTGANLHWSVSGGGAIRANHAELTLTSVHVTGNKAGAAGVYIDRGHLTIAKSVIDQNSNHGGGASGVVSYLDAEVEIVDSVIERNAGGGVRGWNISIHRSRISGHTSGTAVFASGVLTIEDSEIWSNSYFGSAVVSSGELYVTRSSFWKNRSDDTGGAVFVQGTGTITDSNFSENVSKVEGAAIFNRGTLEVRNTTFHDNEASFRGGAILNRGTLDIFDSEFSENFSELGGALYNYASESVEVQAHLEGVSLRQNRAEEQGGAIYNKGALLRVDRSIFLTNIGDAYGAAIRTVDASGVVEITRSTFEENKNWLGVLYGGAISNLNSSVTVADSTLAGNRASYGGAVHSVGGTLNIINSTLSANWARYFGGALHADSTVSISHSTLTGNQSNSSQRSSGGAIFAQSAGNVTLSHNLLIGNFRETPAGIEPNELQLESGVLDSVFSAFNLIGDPTTAGGLLNGTGGNIVGDGSGGVLDVASVLDSTLADNGGATLTHKLLPGSPAIDAGNPLFVPTPDVEFDQRGAGFARVVGERLDLGAFESSVPPAMVSSRLFYNDSIWDGGNETGNELDESAIAPDKVPYVPNGLPATFASVSSYFRGINGVVIDVADGANLMLEDFSFKVGNNNDPNSWAHAPAPELFQVTPGIRPNDPAQVKLIWGVGIRNRWLEIKLLGAVGGEGDVLYWGNKIADSGTGSPTGWFETTPVDSVQIYSTLTSNAALTNVRDYNRDGQVTSNDSVLVYSSLGRIVRLNLPGSVMAAAPLAAADGTRSAVSSSVGTSGAHRLVQNPEWMTKIALAQGDSVLAEPVRVQVVHRLLEPKGIDAVLGAIATSGEDDEDGDLFGFSPALPR